MCFFQFITLSKYNEKKIYHLSFIYEIFEYRKKIILATYPNHLQNYIRKKDYYTMNNNF